MVERALKARRFRPMFLVDIAVPRDIEAEVDELSDAYLYTVDDLQGHHRAEPRDPQAGGRRGGAHRPGRARRLHGLVSQPALGGSHPRLPPSVPAGGRRRAAAALLALQQGENAEQALKAMAHRLTNKLIHALTQALRQAAAQGMPQAGPTASGAGIVTRIIVLGRPFAVPSSIENPRVMNPSLIRKLEGLIERHEEYRPCSGSPGGLGSGTDTAPRPGNMPSWKISFTPSSVSVQAEENLETTRLMLEEEDAELREMAQEELPLAKAAFEEQEQALQVMLLPRDPRMTTTAIWRSAPVPVATRRPFSRGSVPHVPPLRRASGWRVSIVSCNDGEHGGYKEVIAKVDGEHVYGRLCRVRWSPGAASPRDRIPGPGAHLRLHRGRAAGSAGGRAEINPPS